MELKKVGYCYASYYELKEVLKNYKKEYGLKTDKNFIVKFEVTTNKGINFIAVKSFIEFKKFTKFYWPIFGYNAAALKKFELHTNLTALSVREYNDIKGGSPYQVYKNDRYQTIKKKDHVIIKDNMTSLIHSIPTYED